MSPCLFPPGLTVNLYMKIELATVETVNLFVPLNATPLCSLLYQYLIQIYQIKKAKCIETLHSSRIFNFIVDQQFRSKLTIKNLPLEFTLYELLFIMLSL